MLFTVDDSGQLPQGHIIQPIGTRSTCRIDGVWNKPVHSNPTVDDVSAPDFAYASVREIEPQQMANIALLRTKEEGESYG
jgi:hypothetical protein